MTDGTERLDADDGAARHLACSKWSVPLLLEAGAGTGKTAVLVSRIVHWLLGPGWERAAAQLANPTDAEIAIRTASGVVAITFTEAAAAEMASRIADFLAALGKGKPPKELTAADLLRGDDAGKKTKERATHLLGAVDRLRIRTIHGFCHSLLAAHPAEAGLHPAFQVDAEGEGAEKLLVELLEETLPERYQAGEEALLRLAELGHGPAELADGLRQLVATGATADGLKKDPLAPERQQALLERVGELAGKMHRLLEPIAGKPKLKPATRVYEAALSLAESTRQGEKKNRLRRVIALIQEDTSTKELNVLVDWDEVLKTLGKWDKGKFSSNTEREWLGDRVAELSQTARALRGLIGHLNKLDLDGLEALRAALQPALEELERRRRRFGFVSFDELQRFAVRLLEERPAIASSVRQEITQLLVDEFQDTDALQCRLVERLAFEGPPEHRPGLFLVGDPKQSIYGWRRADLAAYEKFATRIEEEGGQRAKLTVNFRSVPPILDEVKRVLKSAFVHEPGVQPEFEPLTASEANRNRRGCDRDGREAVEHWVSWAEGEEKTLAPTAVRIEAAAIAGDIASLRAGGGIVSWEECAILLRATGDLPHYLEALRKAGVPYQVDTDRSFYRQREVIEAAALVRSILDPGDQIALVAFLRSPWVGVPDAALLPLWERGFPAAAADLDGSRPERLEAALAIAREAAREVEAPAREWEVALAAAISGLTDLRTAYRDLPADRFVQALRSRFPLEPLASFRRLGAHRLASLERLFDRLVDDLEAAGGDPAPVLRRLRRAVAEELEEPRGLPRNPGDAVNVMTIHRAKGLDFRFVWLPQLHKQTDRNRRDGTFWKDDPGEHPEYALLGLRTLGMDLVELAAERTARAERIRLLYVAMTRAKERLVTLGNWPGENCPDDTLLRPLFDAIGPAPPPFANGTARDAGGVLWRLAREVPDAPSQVQVSADELVADPTELAVHWAGRRQAADERARRELTTSVTSYLALAHPFPGAVAGEPRTEAEEVATAIGSAVHRFLERLEPGGDWEAESGRCAEELAALLATRPLSSGVRSRAVADLEALLRDLATSPLRPRFDALAGRIVARELPLLVTPPAAEAPFPLGALTASVDLIYLDPDDGSLVIADHKSDQTDDDAALRERYEPQLSLYAAALTRALALPAPPRTELWLLRHGRVLPVGEEPAAT